MKFSIRDLFLVTVIVALALGWILDRSRLAADSQRLKARIEKFEKMTMMEFLDDLRERGKTEDSIDPHVVQHIDEVQIMDRFGPLPDSPAPAPNPPKP